MTSSVIFYSFVSFTEWLHEETDLGRSKTESGGFVFLFRQEKVNFSTIVVWIWIEQVFLDSWSHDNRRLREFAGNRARRPAKQPLLCFSDHWKCLIVEFSFSVSDSFWAIFNLLQIIPCVFHTRWDGFVQIWVLRKSKTSQTRLLCSPPYTPVNGNVTKPNHAIHLVQHLFTIKNHWWRHWNIGGSTELRNKL